MFFGLSTQGETANYLFEIHSEYIDFASKPSQESNDKVRNQLFVLFLAARQVRLPDR